MLEFEVFKVIYYNGHLWAFKGVQWRAWVHFSSTSAVSRKKIKLSSASADFAETKRTETMGIAKF